MKARIKVYATHSKANVTLMSGRIKVLQSDSQNL